MKQMSLLAPSPMGVGQRTYELPILTKCMVSDHQFGISMNGKHIAVRRWIPTYPQKGLVDVSDYVGDEVILSHVSISDDGRTLLLASSTLPVMIIRDGAKTFIHIKTRHKAALTPNGQHALIIGNDNVLHIFDVDNPGKHEWYISNVQDFVLSPNSRRILVNTTNEGPVLWNFTLRYKILTLTTVPFAEFFCVTPNSKFFVVANKRLIYLHDAETGIRTSNYPMRRPMVSLAAGNDFFVVGQYHGGVRVLDMITLLPNHVELDNATFVAVADEKIVTCSRGGCLIVWRTWTYQTSLYAFMYASKFFRVDGDRAIATPLGKLVTR